jgi:hypothetical protein
MAKAKLLKEKDMALTMNDQQRAGKQGTLFVGRIGIEILVSNFCIPDRDVMLLFIRGADPAAGGARGAGRGARQEKAGTEIGSHTNILGIFIIFPEKYIFLSLLDFISSVPVRY